jgi:hypothetical protein
MQFLRSDAHFVRQENPSTKCLKNLLSATAGYMLPVSHES